jgi:hypothetical protein
MGHCSICGTEILYPFECSYCGNHFCSEHRLPENHSCLLIKTNHDYNYNQNSWTSIPPDDNFTQTRDTRRSEKTPVKKQMSKLRLAIIACVLITLATSGFMAGTLNESAINATECANQWHDGYSRGFKDGSNGSNLFTQGNQSGYEQGYAAGVKYMADSTYTLRDPSYAEMMDFLKGDKTDQNRYDESSYVCYDFARDVCNHAMDLRLRCGFVYITFRNAISSRLQALPTSAHAIVCFNTTDKGLIFIEPMEDLPIKLEIGKPYPLDTQYVFTGTDFYSVESTEVIRDYGIIW